MPATAPTKPAYRTLRVFDRGEGYELRVQVVDLEGVSFVDVRMFFRGRPCDEHFTIRRGELPFFIAELMRGSPMIGAVTVCRPPDPADGRARRQLDAARAALTEIKAGVRRSLESGDPAAADEAVDDLIISLMDTPEDRP